MRTIRFDQTGGPEVLKLVDMDEPAPGPGQIRIRHKAIGVNFIDAYHRSGLYPVALPSGLGMEGAGIVDAVGEGVARFHIGERVGYCTGPIGAYGEANVVSADRAVKLPDSVDDDVAAASMLKGMTARYLLKRTYPLKAGDVCVIHAAAGGVGQIAVQWAVSLGATVIGVASTDAKAEIVRLLGAHHVIVSSRENIADRVREITDFQGADVVYDSVGKDTFEASLDSLKPLGMFVSFGNSSGPPPSINPAVLGQKGSLFLTRPSLFHYTRTPVLLQETADDLFDALGGGAVKIAPPTRYALADAGQVHRDLEGRKTVGSLVLAP